MTGLRFKPGVLLARDGVRIQPEMVLAAMVVESVFTRYRLETWITSAMDGRHSNKSLHYRGLALDFRTRHILGGPALAAIVEEIRERLGENYDVVKEPTHLHVEYDPDERGQ